MCRLFGFRSVIPSQMHRSLIAADNALGRQSERHPDGWGVAYYVDGAPHVTRSPAHALGDALFHRVSGVVSSETVLAHVRKATQGALELMGLHVMRADHADTVEEIVSAGFDAAFRSGDKVAVLLGQRLIGRKKWEQH